MPKQLPLPLTETVLPLKHACLGGDWTVNSVREFLTQNIEDGVICPCCEQTVKLYPRKFNANMAQFMISLVRLSFAAVPDGDRWVEDADHGWVKYRDCTYTGRDYSYVKVFGLARTHENTDLKKKESGLWKPTWDGVMFTYLRHKIPSHALMYNGKVWGFTTQLVDIVDALGAQFDYQELMKKRIR